MRTLRLLFHLMRADFLERVRRPGFLLVLGLVVLLAYRLLPAPESQQLALALGPWRSAYSSAWVGLSFGILAVLLLPLAGFFLVKNAINHDRHTRVGQILAATPIRSPIYLLGKWLSNLAVLASLLLVLNVMALAMQLLRAEVLVVDLWALSAPIWLMGLPTLALVAATALWFESLPLLRGGLGNLVAGLAYVATFGSRIVEGQIGMLERWPDPLGLTYPLVALQALALQLDPGYAGRLELAGATFNVPIQLIEWQGPEWEGAVVLERLAWLLIAVGLALAAALVFDRFDPVRGGAGSGPAGRWGRLTRRMARPQRQLAVPALSEAAPMRLTPLASRQGRAGFATTVRAELRLLLAGQPWWLYLLAMLLTAGALLGPAGSAERMLPLAWLWPVLAWSGLGTRERHYHLTPVLYSAQHPVRRQVPAMWLAGVLVALLAAAGMALRLGLAGEWTHLAALAAGALFIPALALALGLISGSARLFQLVYLLWWYLAQNGRPAMDFMHARLLEFPSRLTLIYLALGAGLFALALAARWLRLRLS